MANHALVKTLLVAVSTDGCGEPRGDVRSACARLKQLVDGHITIVTTAGGLTQVSSTVGDSTFSFVPTAGASAVDIADAAVKALAWARRCTTAAQIAAIGYATRKSSMPDFSRSHAL